MKKIDISTPKYPNTFALVDDEDFEYLNQWKWYFIKGHADNGYASRMAHKSEGHNAKAVIMHRVINKSQEGMYTDHINGNGLDNRKCNLRTCDNRQNQGNSKLRKDNKSGFKGVYFDNSEKKWIAGIKQYGKKIKVGHYDTPEEANAAYQKKAKEVFGEFASKV